MLWGAAKRHERLYNTHSVRVNALSKLSRLLQSRFLGETSPWDASLPIPGLPGHAALGGDGGDCQ
jgi:hypothetical protein